MAILGGLNLLNLTLIAANGWLWPNSVDFVRASNQRREEVDWLIVQKTESQGGRARREAENFNSVKTPCPRGDFRQWRPVRGNMQYSALHYINFLCLIHYCVTLTYRVSKSFSAAETSQRFENKTWGFYRRPCFVMTSAIRQVYGTGTDNLSAFPPLNKLIRCHGR